MAPTDHAHQVAAERDNAGTAETADECGEGCCVPATTDARSPCWRHGARRARLLSWLSLIWMSGEGVLGLLAGIRTGSLSLLGWALGSVIEGLASVIVIWRFTGSRTLSDTSEGRAQIAVAVSFFLLAPYLGIQAIRDLLSGHHADISTLGIIVTAASLLVMPALGVAKRRLGAALGSGATTGEGIQNLMCAAQSRGRPARPRRHRRVRLVLARPCHRPAARGMGRPRRPRSLARRRLLLTAPGNGVENGRPAGPLRRSAAER